MPINSAFNPFMICLILSNSYKKDFSHIVQKVATVSFWCPKKRTNNSIWFFSFKLNINSLSECVLYEWDYSHENHHLSQNTSGRGLQASVHWSVELLRALSPALPAGLSCQVDRVVKGWRDNTGWQTERSKAGPMDQCVPSVDEHVRITCWDL